MGIVPVCGALLIRPDSLLTPLAADLLAAISGTYSGAVAVMALASHIVLRGRLSDASRYAYVAILANVATFGDDLCRNRLLREGAGDVLVSAAGAKDATYHSTAALAAAILLGPEKNPLDVSIIRIVKGVIKAVLSGSEYFDIRYEAWLPGMVSWRVLVLFFFFFFFFFLFFFFFFFFFF